ncbi:inorganic phosphate transporter [Cellvibrio japonicus]|uniref:Phosphate transporter n=1 Tax=Cellvibrio japonicus (strain Ueda107) TaxID=498211 RepID=B3PIX0_CELJU|nr:inorganic phosphate transporter [Cellvibrio japonicus]ACE84111.1 pho4 family protein [Cellvibrio japonicus Ueda107]QEI11179.1 inorganic phosphate transporter [Cellvibrio japonicus]QEI14753.1 inorganic phosphate transporter [Cellvibrio japonicus]QEI18333.1 inorganic phosphate transporter [Cellvibrio japonicus]
MTLFAEYGQVLFVLACVFGLFMAWGIGANDVSNAMGTSVGSRALTMKQAIIIAMVFEFAGAYLAGGEVTETIRSGIVELDIMSSHPDLFVYGMLSSLLAAGSWLLIASILGWPVSTTHSIVGAIIGFAAVGISVDAVQWGQVWGIVGSWIITPVIAGFISFWIFRSVQHLILDTEDPFGNAKRYIPFYMFAVGFFLSMVTLLKGLKYVLKEHHIEFGFIQAVVIAALIGIAVAGIGIYLLSRINQDTHADKSNRFSSVERVFGVLMIFTACSMAFAHGSNDVANAVGPVAAVIAVVQAGAVETKALVPSWVLLLGATGIVIGLATYGYKVMVTIGKKITELTPSRGFAAEMAAAATVVIASGIGLPISTTHTLVGAVLGVGLARGIGALNLGVIGGIFASWVITLPAGAGLSILFFYFFKGLFS